MERSGRVISAETEACQFTETADAGQILLISDEEQLLEVRHVLMKRIAAISPGGLPTRGSPFKASGFFPAVTLDNSPFRSHILFAHDSRDESQFSELSGECGFMRSANVAWGARATEDILKALASMQAPPITRLTTT